MSLSRDDAAKALEEIEAANVRSSRLRGYRYGSPHVLMWGVQWLVANTTVQYAPELANLFWFGGVAVICVASVIIGSRQGGDRRLMSDIEQAQAKQWRLRWGLAGAASWIGFIALFAILWPFDAREFTAAISLIWMVIYMVGGLWTGWRLFWIGLVAFVAIVAGYFLIKDYFYLWMGLVGGGSLIAGGLWMRKV